MVQIVHLYIIIRCVSESAGQSAMCSQDWIGARPLSKIKSSLK